MKARTYLLGLIATLSLQGNAIVNTTAGSLKSTLSQDQLSASTLQIEGKIDAADLEFLGGLTTLTNLDLTRATIVEYDGQRLTSGAVHSDANRIPDYAFLGSTITSISLPTSLEAIGEGAFAGSKLTSINIAASVNYIGEYVFSDCSELETANIGTPDIPKGSFRACSKLRSIGVSTTLSSVGDDAFAGCSSLDAFSFYENVATIGHDAFSGTALRMVDLSRCKHMTTIGDRAFADCTSLTSVYLPSSLTSIGKGVFFDNVALEGITLPAGITEIPDLLFKGAFNVSERTIAAMTDITTIGDYAFMDLTAIANWKVPEGLVYIGTGAMEGMTGLEEINASRVSAVPELGENVWAGVDQSSVLLIAPENLEDEFAEAPQWKEFNLLRNSGVDDIENDLATTGNVEFYIEGNTLHIVAATDINNVALYDITGHTIATLLGVNSATTSIDLTGTQPGILIITVETADNKTTTAKFVYKG